MIGAHGGWNALDPFHKVPRLLHEALPPMEQPTIIAVDSAARAALFLALLRDHYEAHRREHPGFTLASDWLEHYGRGLERGRNAPTHRFTLAVTDANEESESAGKNHVSRSSRAEADQPGVRVLGLCASWWREEHVLAARRIGTVSELYVASDCRRRGIGRALASDALRWLASAEVKVIEAATPIVAGAQGFWEKLGFTAETVVLKRIAASVPARSKTDNLPPKS